MHSSHDRIRMTRRVKDLTGAEVAEKLGISTQYYYNIERGRRKLSADHAMKLAELFGVSLDYLLGQSVQSLIEDKLHRSGVTIGELAERAQVSRAFIEGLGQAPLSAADTATLHRVAEALGLDRDELQAAAATPPAELAQNEKAPTNAGPTAADDDMETMAAHHEGEDWTEEELEEIRQFKEFVRSKRNRRG